MRPLALGVAVLSSFVALCEGCAVLWPDGRAPIDSLGGPANGALLRPVRVPERAPGFSVYRTEAEGGQLYTTRRLRDAVLESASRVARLAPGGTELVAGDFSAPWGGRIDRHRSHRNGRDVDILYFALDRTTGRPTRAPGFVRYDREGNPRDRDATVRMDLERNWLLVESLVRDERFGVAYVFCAEWIKQALLRWARSHDRDPRWIERASRVMHQPGDAAPHDDHFHVRVLCSTEDRLRGCVDGGPRGWWLDRAHGKPDAAPGGDLEIAWESTAIPQPVAAPTQRHRSRR
ncbi:MAG: penicillin-insensitive murein endopeptidase [Polyangiales bacterium]